MADYDMEMMGYKLEMVCDKESGPSPTIMESAEEMWGGWMGTSAVRVASGIISAAAIISSICWFSPNNISIYKKPNFIQDMVKKFIWRRNKGAQTLKVTKF